MKLVDKQEQTVDSSLKTETANSYIPLVVITSLIFLSALVISYKTPFSVQSFVSNFMIGFFLVFSGFKLVDLKGFAEGYATYDLLAQKWYSYGFVYPFIELFFGLIMILGIFSRQILLLEILIMGFSGVGVAIKLAKREKFQCACLGTFLKVPLTWITLLEDFGMVALALFLLLNK